MKCPKCGYHSFEYNDTCRKCANDLTSYKATHGITPIVMPLEARTALAASLYAADGQTGPDGGEIAETAADMFSFDLPEQETASVPASSAAKDDPFSFTDDSASDSSQGFGDFSFDDPVPAPPTALPEGNDAFGGLIEQTSPGASPFGAAAPAQSPSAAPPAASSAGPGEFDLDSFSWDETPVASSGADGKTGNDDFDSLFGEMDATKKA